MLQVHVYIGAYMYDTHTCIHAQIQTETRAETQVYTYTFALAKAWNIVFVYHENTAIIMFDLCVYAHLLYFAESN